MIKADRPRSPHEILMLSGNLVKRAGYRIRARLANDIEHALERFYLNGVEMFGEEHAACLLAHVLAHAPPSDKAARRGGRNTGVSGSYLPAPWAMEVLAKHRVAIAAAFAADPSHDGKPCTEGNEYD